MSGAGHAGACLSSHAQEVGRSECEVNPVCMASSRTAGLCRDPDWKQHNNSSNRECPVCPHYNTRQRSNCSEASGHCVCGSSRIPSLLVGSSCRESLRRLWECTCVAFILQEWSFRTDSKCGAVAG